MKKLKIIAIIFALLLANTNVNAESIDDIKSSLTKVQELAQKYEQNLKNLQTENENLKKTIEELRAKIESLSTTSSQATQTKTVTQTGTQATISTQINTKASSVNKYNKLVDIINSQASAIFTDQNLSTNSSIGLFEFIEPANFFISIDDGNNPAGITAFKRKILYSYNKDLNLNIVGVFDLDYKSQYYVTKYGKNPFAATARIRVKNPNYKGKLLSDTTANTAQTQAQTTTNTQTTTTKIETAKVVTYEQVRDAYSKNKILDMLKLSDEYIKSNPDDINVLRMRYRGFYMIGKYSDSLSEIKKIESIEGTDKMTKVVACDGSIIAKLAKDMNLNKVYGDICKK